MLGVFEHLCYNDYLQTGTSMTTTITDKEKSVTITNPKIDALAREKLVTARVGLLLKASFFGNLATRLKLLNADDWCSTAATDGRNFYYNSEFINSLSLKECEFLFGHEVLHVVYDHIGRREDRNPILSNIAADYCVNQDLIDYNIGQRITKVKILYDRKYKGMSFEEVYDDLYKNATKINMQDLLDQILDEHMDGDGGGGDGVGEGEGPGSGKRKKPSLSQEELKEIRDEIKEAVLQAGQASGAGNLPAGVQRLISDMTESIINWRELLLQQIQSTIKQDYSWMRTSRRSWHMDAVMPGMIPGDTVDVCIAIDTSGSITEKELKIFLSEIKGIMESYTDYKIHLWCFDTAVHNPQVFNQETMHDILTYEPKGGGGTDFDANWTFMKENQIEPKKLIVFTDMCPFGSWGDPDYCDTVWISVMSDTIAPFGITAKYEDSLK